MNRHCVITVGTSLLHSASWRPEIFGKQADDYRRWIESEIKPEARKSDRAVQQKVEEQVLGAEPETLARFFAADAEGGLTHRPPHLYSAELATLAVLAGAYHGSLRACLRGYQSIRLVADDSGAAENATARTSWVAARHLVAYLRRLYGDGGDAVVDVLKITGIASRHPDELRDATLRLGGAINGQLQTAAEIDIVVTGGYKLYGYFLAPLVVLDQANRLRLHYLHEEGDGLVTLTRNRFRIGEDEVVEPYRTIGFGSEEGQ